MYMYGTIRISWDDTLGLIAEDSQERMMPLFLRYPEQTHEEMVDQYWAVRLLEAFPDVAPQWVNVEPLPLEDLYVEGSDAAANEAQLVDKDLT
jgi:hypothetical protein